MLNVVVVPARCAVKGQLLCLRVQEDSPGRWLATWAFKMQADKAKREGYASRTLEGAFSIAEGYPGCPYCESPSFYVCGCGTVVCWNAVDQFVTCPECRSGGNLSGTATTIRAKSDR